MPPPDADPPEASIDADALRRAYREVAGSGEWQIDQPDQLWNPEPDPVEESVGLRPPLAEEPPIALAIATPVADADLESDVPPSPVQILEALLFAGGESLTPERAAQILRSLDAETFHQTIDLLNRVYRLQNRPYHVARRADGGYALAVRPRYRAIRERLHGGPKEARLTQPLLDVLGMVAYRQPVGRHEIDAARGSDSGALMRQLLRLGLIAVARRAGADSEALYATTARFLDLFGLRDLDDLPRLSDPKPVAVVPDEEKTRLKAA